MKNVWLYLFITLCCFKGVSQTNLVSNPSFETYTNCPYALDRLYYCQGWSSFSYSPDYFNTCAVPWCLAPPNTCVGYQQPFDGHAYAGVVSWYYTIPNFREIIGSQLISPLSIGVKYYFTFYVSFAGIPGVNMATDKMGLRFSTVPYSVSNPIPINNFAHYFCPTKITDSLNWTRLKGSFVADSIYKYIAFGNFFDDANTGTLSTGSSSTQGYYFIDNICLSTDSNLCNISTGIKNEEINSFFRVYPNPTSGLFTVQLLERGEYTYEIKNHLGQLITRNDINSDQNKIDLSNQPIGVYFIQVKSEQGILTKKIILNK